MGVNEDDFVLYDTLVCQRQASTSFGTDVKILMEQVVVNNIECEFLFRPIS